MPKKVLILGAGVTGLSAAWKILQSGSPDQVLVLEKDRVPGGLAKTIHWNGFYLDLGPHRIFTDIPGIQEFLSSFCSEHLVRVKRASRMYLQGHYISYPIHFLETFQSLGVMTSVGFGLSALKVLFCSQKSALLSYEDYMTGYYGEDLYRKIFQPFAKKVWGVSGKELAAETAKVRLRGNSIWHALKDSLFAKEETYVSEFWYPEKGIGEIADHFARDIEEKGGMIFYQSNVTQVNMADGMIRSVTVAEGHQQKEYACDYLINTIPLPDLVDTLHPAVPDLVRSAGTHLHFRALVLVYLFYEKNLGIEDTWFYFPEEQVPFTRVSVPDNFSPGVQPKDQTCLCVEFTCETGDEVWNTPVEILAQKAQQVLQESRLVQQNFSQTFSVKIEAGYPVYTVGYETARQTVLDFADSLNNLLTTGRQGLFRHNNIDQSIQMGLLAADEVMKNPAAFKDWYNNAARFDDYRIID